MRSSLRSSPDPVIETRIAQYELAYKIQTVVGQLQSLGAQFKIELRNRKRTVTGIELRDSPDGKSKIVDANLRIFSREPVLKSPQCVHLVIEASRVTDVGLAHLSGLTPLRTLSLRSTKITNSGLASLKKLKQLEQLDLSGTGIGDTGMKHLAGLAKLRLLDVRGTKVTKQAVKRLQSMLNVEVKSGPDDRP